MYLYTLYFETIIIPSEEVTSCMSYSICTNETYPLQEMVLYMTFFGGLLRNHHRITLSVMVLSKGDTTVTASLIFVIVWTSQSTVAIQL
jgi:hypothetical protein